MFVFDEINQYVLQGVVFPSVVMGFGLFFLISRLLPDKHHMDARKMQNSLITFNQGLLITFANLSLSAFKCFLHPNGKKTLFPYPAILCWAGDHGLFVVVSVIMCCVVLMPFNVTFVYAVHKLYRHRGDPRVTIDLLVRFKLFFSRWRPERWYWGFVFTVRQQLLVLSLMVAGDDVYSQFVWTTSVLTAHVVLLTFFMPWRMLEMNVLEISTVTLTILLLFCVGAFLEPSVEPTKYDAAQLTIMVVAFVLILLSIIRVALFVLLRGRKGRYPSNAKSMPLDMRIKCFETIREFAFSQEILEHIFDSFTESDITAMAQFVNALQSATAQSLTLPVDYGARIYVPSVRLNCQDKRSKFVSSVKEEVSQSKLESYI